jgi:hypoxanthine phosphoribosyltransferase
VSWEYEPVEFVLEWDGCGRPASAFRPDFYLPELDLFLELTTLRQGLVTRKHRKLRRLRELYPETQVRLLYRRDDAHLLAKSRLAAALAGSTGVPAPRQDPVPSRRRAGSGDGAATAAQRRLVG